MTFNYDISKQAQEVTFSREAVQVFYPAVFVNDIPEAYCSIHKHLGMYVLEEKLNFGHLITENNANTDAVKNYIMLSHIRLF